jgi:hypothetical protein
VDAATRDMSDAGDGVERLRWYQKRRRSEAAERERKAVEAALEKPVEERTEAEAASSAYSVSYGTAAGCRCGR